MTVKVVYRAEVARLPDGTKGVRLARGVLSGDDDADPMEMHMESYITM